MSRARRIGILTGGGDVPGLNSVIKSVVYSTTEIGYEVLGIRRGWMGLTHLQQGKEFDPAYIRSLNRASTRGIDRTGGTTLHTSRVNPPKMRRAAMPQHLSKEKVQSLEIADGIYDVTPVVLDNIAYLGLDYLVVIGGDDTLSFAKVLDSQGVRIVGIPKTMDNDVQGTEYCIGFSTAITPRQGVDHAPAHHARFARAHRDLPHLWPRLRVHGALYRVCHFGPVRHTGGEIQSRASD